MHVLYAGSFDPPTLGHLDLIRRAAALCERVTVAVGQHPAKRYWFSREQRVAMLEQDLAGLDRVWVTGFDGLVAPAARELGADALLRGVRGPSDLDLELRNAQGNRVINGIETLLLIADPALAYVSSSLVREIAGHGGPVDAMVSPGVLRALAARER